MNPLKSIGNVLTTGLTLLFLMWFSLFWFRLGFKAHDNPLLYPMAVMLAGDDKPPQQDKKDCYQIARFRLGRCP